MSNTPKSPLNIGDYAIEIVPALATSDHLDTEANRERARREDEDERAAQHDGGEAEGEAGRADAEAAVDASIAEARERAKGAESLPILLRDPVTGKVVTLE